MHLALGLLDGPPVATQTGRSGKRRRSAPGWGAGSVRRAEMVKQVGHHLPYTGVVCGTSEVEHARVEHLSALRGRVVGHLGGHAGPEDVGDLGEDLHSCRGELEDTASISIP